MMLKRNRKRNVLYNVLNDYNNLSIVKKQDNVMQLSTDNEGKSYNFYSFLLLHL